MPTANCTNTNSDAANLAELAALHAALLGGAIGGDGIITGQGGDVATPSTPIVINRPWIDPPDGFIPFDPQVSIPLPAVGSSAIVVEHDVPDGFDGVINQYSWNFTGGGFVQGSGDIIVQIQRNGAAVRNYESITVEKGSVGHARRISPIRIFSKQKITMVVTHAANGALTGNVIGSFVGYDYPAKG